MIKIQLKRICIVITVTTSLFALYRLSDISAEPISKSSAPCTIGLPIVSLNPFLDFEQEGNNGISAANGPIRPNKEYKGRSNDNVDIFFIPDVGRGPLAIALDDFVGENVFLTLYHEDNTTDAVAFINWPQEKTLSFNIQNEGRYYLQISTTTVIDPNAIYRFTATYTQQNTKRNLEMNGQSDSVSPQTVINCFIAANWTLLEDFDSLTVGPIDGQNGWSGTNNPRVQTDPVDSGNQMLLMDEPETRTYKSLPSEIPDSSAGSSLFFRLRREDSIDGFGGLSDVTMPDVWGDYEAQFGGRSEHASLFSIRDDNNFVTSNSLFNSHRWYCVWIIVNNSADSYEIYVQGDQFEEQTQIQTGSGQSTFKFRNGGSESIKTFYGRMASTFDGVTMIDDVYVSPEKINLSKPISGCS